MKFKIFCFISIFFIITKVKSADFIDKGYYIIDLVNKVEWLKCTVGQVWDEDKKKCLGSAKKLNMEEIKEANIQINQQLEGEWRLPKRKELEGLICKDCEGAKIDKRFFPIRLLNLLDITKKLVVTKIFLVSKFFYWSYIW